MHSSEPVYTSLDHSRVKNVLYNYNEFSASSFFFFTLLLVIIIAILFLTRIQKEVIHIALTDPFKYCIKITYQIAQSFY